MARLNLDKMSSAELSELRSQVDRLMVEKQSSEKSALRQKMVEMAEAAGMSLVGVACRSGWSLPPRATRPRRTTF